MKPINSNPKERLHRNNNNIDIIIARKYADRHVLADKKQSHVRENLKRPVMVVALRRTLTFPWPGPLLHLEMKHYSAAGSGVSVYY